MHNFFQSFLYVFAVFLLINIDMSQFLCIFVFCVYFHLVFVRSIVNTEQGGFDLNQMI